MAEFDMEKKKSGGAFRGVIIIVLLGVLGFVVYGMTQSPATEASKARATPEGALKHYCITVHRFLRREKGGSVQDVMDCLPKADAKWFNDHYKELLDDPFELQKGMDPVVSGIVGRDAALANLLQMGPTRGDVEVLKTNLGDKKSTISVRQKYYGGWSQDFDVELVRVGNEWKVVDFGGGKKAFATGGGGGAAPGGNSGGQ